MKIYFKNILICFASIILIVLIGYSFLVASYSIPYSAVSENIDSASDVFENEGLRFSYLFNQKWFYLDNDTNAQMLSVCAGKVLVDKNEDNVAPATDTLMNYYTVKDGGESALFHSATLDDNSAFTWEYLRYWHGYVALLKPLLCLFPYSVIRCISAGFSLILTALVFILLWRKYLKHVIIPFAVFCFFLSIPLSCISLQLASSVNISLLMILFLLLFYNKLKSKCLLGVFFFTSGAILNYFDFFTYPLICFAVPFTFVFIFEYKSASTSKLFKLLVTCFLFWSAGFMFMWAAKWMLCALLTNADVIASLTDRWSLRTSSQGFAQTQINYLDVVLANFYYILKRPVFIVLFILIVLILIILLKKTGTFSTKKMSKDTEMPKATGNDNNPIVRSIPLKFKCAVINAFKSKYIILLILALLPLLWFAFLQNHSYENAKFVYRVLSIDVFIILTWLSLPRQ